MTNPPAVSTINNPARLSIRVCSIFEDGFPGLDLRLYWVFISNFLVHQLPGNLDDTWDTYLYTCTTHPKTVRNLLRLQCPFCLSRRTRPEQQNTWDFACPRLKRWSKHFFSAYLTPFTQLNFIFFKTCFFLIKITELPPPTGGSPAEKITRDSLKRNNRWYLHPIKTRHAFVGNRTKDFSQKLR